MKVTVLNDDGRVISIITVDDATGSNMRTREGTYAIGVVPDNFSDYWDGTKFVAIGDEPSKYHYFDYDTKQWIDAATVDILKQDARIRVRELRDMLDSSTVTYNGAVLDADAVSKAKLQTTMLAGNDAYWITHDNDEIELTATDLTAIFNAIAERTAKLFAATRLAYAAIAASDDKDFLRSVTLTLDD